MSSIHILAPAIAYLLLSVQTHAEVLRLALIAQPQDEIVAGLHLALGQSPSAPISLTLHAPNDPVQADIIASAHDLTQYESSIRIALGPNGQACQQMYLDLHGAAHPDAGPITDHIMGTYSIAPWAYDLGGENDANQGFVALFHDRHGQLPSLNAAIGYDLGNLLLSTLNVASPQDHVAFFATMQSSDFISVRGELQFTAHGAPLQRQYLRQMRQTPFGPAHSYIETLPDVPPAQCEG
ncbi:ABC transporter substrate-binding protein [Monaibacterium marinum]|nr:ABC transporter substrate-binding protein [Monaibacterium marinum]